MTDPTEDAPVFFVLNTFDEANIDLHSIRVDEPAA